MVNDALIENELRPTLEKGERLLWVGQPKHGIRFYMSDILVIPFSIIWCGFVVAWEVVVLMELDEPSPLFFKLWGIPFVIAGLYFMIGRFFADAAIRKHTFYGITEHRIIIKTGVFEKQVQSLQVKSLFDITIAEKKDGTGTIYFGPIYYRLRNFIPWMGKRNTPCLDQISQVRDVYDLIAKLQRQSG